MNIKVVPFVLLAACSTGESALSATEELLLSATTGGEEMMAVSGDTLSPSAIPASERPDPFRVCDASGTYTGLFTTYDADADGALDAPESADVMAARDGRSAGEDRMARMQWALLLTIYDADGSASLEEGERATLLDDFTSRCSAIQALLLADFDADGDGVLSTDEQDTARAAIEAEMEAEGPPPEGGPECEGRGEGMEGAPPDGPPTAGEAPPIPPPLMDEFDADADGALDAAELATLQETMRARIRSGEPLRGM